MQRQSIADNLTVRGLRIAVMALYLLTPIFWLLDALGYADLRLPNMLDSHAAARWTYYGVLTLLGIGMTLLPRLIGTFAVLESAINLALTATGLATTYVGILDRATTGQPEPATAGATPVNMASVAIALGTILICYFAAQCEHLSARKRGRQKPDGA